MRPPPPQILDFGFRILDFGALCSNSSCFGFWISDFGFWFGGVFADIFWILQKIKITVHADPGRRIYIQISVSKNSRTGCTEVHVHFALVGAWTGMDIPIQLKDMKGTFATTEPGTVPWRLQIEEFIV